MKDGKLLRYVRDSELKIYLNKGNIYYEHKGVMDLVKRHDKLVDLINRKG